MNQSAYKARLRSHLVLENSRKVVGVFSDLEMKNSASALLVGAASPPPPPFGWCHIPPSSLCCISSLLLCAAFSPSFWLVVRPPCYHINDATFLPPTCGWCCFPPVRADCPSFFWVVPTLARFVLLWASSCSTDTRLVHNVLDFCSSETFS